MTLTAALRRLLAKVLPGGFAASATAQHKLTLMTGWYARAGRGGFHQAVATGPHRKHGLDVTIRMGGPQVNGLQLLRAGPSSSPPRAGRPGGRG